MRRDIVDEDIQRVLERDLPWGRLAGKTVLVTGASGFLPAYMVEALLALNAQECMPPIKVVALVRSLQRAEARFSRHLHRPDLCLVEGDVSEPLPIAESCHFVVHAASQAAPKYYGSDPVGTLLANTAGTRNLLDAATRWRSEAFMFFSSGEVYGDVLTPRISETDFGPLDPMSVRSCYGESKRMGETMCASWHAQYGLPTVVVRPFHTYGPGLRLDDGRVFADFVSDIVAGRDIRLSSDGAARRAFCYLGDATAGFFTVLLKGMPGQAYNIGNDQGEYSILELAELLVQLFPEKGLRVVRVEGPGGGYIRSPLARNCPDTTKARALGWAPSTSVGEGFRRTVLSFG